MKPLRTGIALSLTLMAFYSLCTLVAMIWPEQFTAFVNSLAHGLDFRKLATAEPYTWTSFLRALAALAIWGFSIGAFFAWLHGAISGPSFGRATHE